MTEKLRFDFRRSAYPTEARHSATSLDAAALKQRHSSSGREGREHAAMKLRQGTCGDEAAAMKLRQGTCDTAYGDVMGVTYFKRYRMELDLRRPLFEVPAVPEGYEFFPWRESLLELHVDAKYRSFCHEIDANVFPCLGQRDGCHRLMTEISNREGFLAEATWLVGWRLDGRRKLDCCGTVQGIYDRESVGSIQNLGIIPEHRGLGLGTLLLGFALKGFRNAGIERASLEVTAKNRGAVRLYRRLGFRTTKTVYKAVEVAYA